MKKGAVAQMVRAGQFINYLINSNNGENILSMVNLNILQSVKPFEAHGSSPNCLKIINRSIYTYFSADNARVVGSIPTCPTKMVKINLLQIGTSGSNPPSSSLFITI